MSRDENAAPHPAPIASGILILGLCLTYFFAGGETPSELATGYAKGVLISLITSIVFDLRKNPRNLVRADLMAIFAFYFLTLFEFLYPQDKFNDLVDIEETKVALQAVLLSFGGLAIGRHLAPKPGRSMSSLLKRNIGSSLLITLFTISLIGGYLHMLAAVDFNFGRMIDYFMAPRFAQPWGRGKFGDWKALLGELGMVLYLVPPIAGIIFAKRSDYSFPQKLYVTAGFLFTLFYGFSSGTRNIFASYLATFIVAYAFTLDRAKKKELFMVGGAVAAMMLAATTIMLEFRNIGLQNYIHGYKDIREAKSEENFFVDYNLFVIAKLTTVFPAQHDYLGFEIPYLAAIRPIPRAIWSGKPEGLSFSIEDAVGVEGLTLASSFAGEAYISGGLIGALITGLFFGGVLGWWNQFGRADNSPFGHLVFASGFFAAVISMRSMFVFTTAMLPTLAALVLGNWFLTNHPIQLRHDEDDTHSDDPDDEVQA